MSIPENYILGQSQFEQERLMMQARILWPYTESFFRKAGIEQGMSVLDIGSGVGDVALLAADLVGPRGLVLGLDRDDVSLQRARERTVHQGCSSWVSFETTTLDDFSSTRQFDAIVGRYVLLYQPDAAATLRHLTRFLRPGGIVAFHEPDFTCPTPTTPACDFLDQVLWLVPQAFRLAGLPADFGRHLASTFLGANLPFPSMAAEIPVGGASGSSLYSWIASTVISLAPRFESLGMSLPPGVVADHTLAAKLEEASLATGSQLMLSIQYGAWTRKSIHQ
jgi:ubiquinone/menaquinone biosynthesis C-methylase UbiE